MLEFELSEQQKAIKGLVREFAEKELAPVAAELDEKEEFSRENFDKMAKLGFAGVVAPEEYGGMGLDYVTFAIILEELAKVCFSTAVCLFPHTVLLICLHERGTKEQKIKYLTPLAKGEKLGAFALTEPLAGSDAASMQSTAVLAGDHYILNGTKCFITNGGEAELYMVMAKTDKEKGARGVSSFIVEKGASGFSFGRKERKMGVRANSTRELIFEDCPVAKANLLGKEGEGFRIAMRGLDAAKIFAGATAVGLAQSALDAAVKYAKERVQFGRPIGEFQSIQFMLVNMAIETEASRLLTYKAAYLMDKGLPAGNQAAMAKVFATDMAMRVTTDAVQVFGGYGYMKDYPVERYMRDAKIGQIFDGTNEIQRMIIGRYLLG